MKRLKIIVVALLLAVTAGIYTPAVTEAGPFRLPEGDDRVCPEQRPNSVTGSVEHRKRGSSQFAGSDRFYIRLVSDAPPYLIDHEVTGSNGNFKLCFGDDDLITGPDTWVAVFSAYTPDIPRLQVLFTDAPDDPSAVWLYQTDKAVFLFPGQDADAGILTIAQGSPEETAFRIKDDLQGGYDLVNGEIGPVEAEWPHDLSFPGADFRSLFCYDPPPDPFADPFGSEPFCVEPRVYLKDTDGENVPDTVVHEMGHHVMYDRYDQHMPAPSTDYYWFSLFDVQWGPCEDHYLGKEIQTQRDCIWQEDWANFWAIAVNDDPHLYGYDLENPPIGWPTGDDTEGRISAALWDIYDSPADGADAVALGLDPIWYVLQDIIEDDSFESYWERWKIFGQDQCAVTSIYQNTIEYDANDWVACADAQVLLTGKTFDGGRPGRVGVALNSLLSGGAEVQPPGGIGALENWVTYYSAGIELLQVVFPAGWTEDPNGTCIYPEPLCPEGEARFKASTATSPASLGEPMAYIYPRLTGSAGALYTLQFPASQPAQPYTYSATGTGASAGSGGTITATFRRGDVNSDDAIDVLDAIAGLRMIVRAIEPCHDLVNPSGCANPVNVASIVHDDCTSQDNVNVQDVVKMLRLIVGHEQDFPNQCPGGAMAQVGGQATIAITSDTVPSGSTGSAHIVFGNNTDPAGLGGYELEVTFDPAVIQVDSVSGGQGQFSDAPTVNIDNGGNGTAGTVLMAHAIGTDQGPTSILVLASLNFTAIGPPGSETPLDLTVRSLANSQAEAMTGVDVDGTITVE